MEDKKEIKQNPKWSKSQLEEIEQGRNEIFEQYWRQLIRAKNIYIKLLGYIEDKSVKTKLFDEFKDYLPGELLSSKRLILDGNWEDLKVIYNFLFSWSYKEDGLYTKESHCLDWMPYFLGFLDERGELCSYLTEIGFYDYAYNHIGLEENQINFKNQFKCVYLEVLISVGFKYKLF